MEDIIYEPIPKHPDKNPNKLRIVKDDDDVKKKHIIIELDEYLKKRYDIRRNVLSQEIQIKGKKQKDFEILDDQYVNSIFIDLSLDGFRISDMLLAKILYSKLTKSFNPIEDYFNSLPEWDKKTDHIAALAKSVSIKDIVVENGEESFKMRELWPVYFKKWFVATAACGLGKSINHTCLILAGPQGLFKTTWLNSLAPKFLYEYLVCGHLNPSLNDNQTSNYLAEKFIINIDDQLESIMERDYNSLKALITIPSVSNRKAYHRFSPKRKRVASFCGSVNEPKFLYDNENRRYIVFTVDMCDVNKKINLDGAWAQAYHILKNDKKFIYWFTNEEIRVLNLINYELYKKITDEEEFLKTVFEPTTAQDPGAKFYQSTEVLKILNKFSGVNLSLTNLSKALIKLKYPNVSKRIGNDSIPRYVYVMKEINSDKNE